MKPVSIALIGGGAAATLFLAHLMRQENLPPLAITIFDRAGRFGAGIAYSTTNPSHLLNVRTENMSAFHHQPDHFARWLEREEPGGITYIPHDFAPRMTYRTYLGAVLAEAIDTAMKNGHRVTQTRAEIERIESLQEGYDLISGGQSWQADHVLIATGNAFPIAPAGASRLTTADGYHDDPWTAPYADIAAADHVVVLGTGLSMIDTVIALDSAGFHGRITAISRHCLMPAVHVDSTAAFPVTTHEPPAPTALAYVRFVRAHARAAEAQGLSWQAAINGLRSVTNDWWLRLPEGEQQKLKRALPFWNVHRHRTAPKPGALLRSWRDSGRLKLVKGRVTMVRKIANGISVDYGSQNMSAPHVINCLGYGCTPASSFPGGNIKAPTLYGIGPVLCDRLVETTAIPEIRKTASDLADGAAALLRARSANERAARG